MKNIMEKGGYPLVILANRNRAPVDDLVARGAREAKMRPRSRPNAMVVTCLPSAVELSRSIWGRAACFRRRAR
jgi:hypothetical protein